MLWLSPLPLILPVLLLLLMLALCCSWLDFVERKLKFVAVVVRLQSNFRRKGPMKYLQWLRERFQRQPFAATQIQRFWRHRRRRVIINKFLRLKRLLQYKVRVVQATFVRVT